LAENGNDVLKRYLVDAIAAERSFESQLRSFAGEGDDQEVQGLFLRHADETRSQHARLAARLEQLGGSTSLAKELLAQFLSHAPAAAKLTHTAEERIVQNLVIAFSVESSECALYESLATVANALGDTTTEKLARAIQDEERRTAEAIWHFLPSRSKIAFNILTAGEVDPAVETRTVEDRLV
jgi:ferritin-like metal-binding protein YciE